MYCTYIGEGCKSKILIFVTVVWLFEFTGVQSVDCEYDKNAF